MLLGDLIGSVFGCDSGCGIKHHAGFEGMQATGAALGKELLLAALSTLLSALLVVDDCFTGSAGVAAEYGCTPAEEPCEAKGCNEFGEYL